MSLVVEDGTVVAGANSFVSLANFKTYCDNRGRDYSSYDDDSAMIPALITMADYLNSLNWKGFKTDRANPMSWPRYGDTLSGWNEMVQPASQYLGVIDGDGYMIGTSEIPAEVIDAQCEGAWLIVSAGAEMEPALERGGQIRREKYDVVEWEYFSGASTSTEYKSVTNRLQGLLQDTTTKWLVRA